MGYFSPTRDGCGRPREGRRKARRRWPRMGMAAKGTSTGRVVRVKARVLVRSHLLIAPPLSSTTEAAYFLAPGRRRRREMNLSFSRLPFEHALRYDPRGLKLWSEEALTAESMSRQAPLVRASGEEVNGGPRARCALRCFPPTPCFGRNKKRSPEVLLLFRVKNSRFLARNTTKRCSPGWLRG